MRIGLLPLARPTFDVEYANEKLAAILSALDQTRHEFVGSRELLMGDEDATESLSKIEAGSVDYLLILQVTFTDASFCVNAAKTIDAPMGIWAVPEPRLGGRLRLNAFCGLNLASHALGLNNRAFSWIYSDADTGIEEKLGMLLSGDHSVKKLDATESGAVPGQQAKTIISRIREKRIGRIGEHPVGFDTCAYSPEKLKGLSGVQVDEIELEQLFDTARGVAESDVDTVRAKASELLAGTENVDQVELDRSLRLKSALDKIRASGKYDAFAIRCWPETFTEYGGAVCGPVSMLGEARVPCACEADVYGALTQLILQEATDEPVFLADIVDMDLGDDTGVIWHCGQAPISMCDEEVAAEATIHTNRKMPLLFEFPLKPGRVTFMRISQAYGEPKMIIATGDMLKRPKAFIGTSGVVKFDKLASETLDNVIGSGLEHHTAIAYGDHAPILREVAAAMNLPVLEL